ncbi:MAG: polyprenol monophosphomannose synthase [Bacteroidia bacterium]|jgi:dolichol-phosphate mannosyltransferase|nr:polyprenol monophosphomannose synthase [Bacteroidia bacterium]
MNPIVIIPTYNEKENITAMLDKVMSLDVDFDVLVVDDNSPDGTANLVKQKQADNSRIYLLENGEKNGLGTAYIAGFKWCLKRSYEYVFEMDCDFSHNPEDLIRLYNELREGHCDLVVGSRYVGNVVNVVNWPMGRVLLSYFASAYVRFFTRMKLSDATAGFVGYNSKLLKTIDLDKIQFRGYAFQIEMKYTTFRLGFSIKEIPIIFTDRTAGESKMNGSIIKEALFGVLWLRFKSIRPKTTKI